MLVVGVPLRLPGPGVGGHLDAADGRALPELELQADRRRLWALVDLSVERGGRATTSSSCGWCCCTSRTRPERLPASGGPTPEPRRERGAPGGVLFQDI